MSHIDTVMDDLDSLEATARSPRKLALLRIEKLRNGKEGLASELAANLQSTINSWLSTKPAGGVALRDTNETIFLRRVLNVYLDLAQADSILAGETAAQGSHRQLLRLVSFCADDGLSEDDQDVILELQDLACQISSYNLKFPQKELPYSATELRARLPLVFSLEDENTTQVLIHQVTSRQSAQADVGFVMWPSSVVLARWLAQNSSLLLEGKRVLELGSGCGLVGLSAALIRQQQYDSTGKEFSPVILTDFNPIVLENLRRCVEINNLSKDECTVAGLDFYDQSGITTNTTTNTMSNGWVDMDGGRREPVDLVLGADIICQAEDAYAAANCIYDVLKPGGYAIVVCPEATQRFGVEHFLKACRDLQLETTVRSMDDDNTIDDLKKTSGYVPGMSLSMFTIQKKPMAM